MKEDYQKTFKNSTLIFPLHPVPFYGQDYEKQMDLGTSSFQPAFGLQNVFRKISFLVVYHLGNFDDLIQGGV